MLEEMTKAELLTHAETLGIIEIPKRATKAEIIELINQTKNVEEDTTMEIFNEEVKTEETVVEETVADEKKYILADGSEGTRSAYIRQEFKKDRSRNDIAKELGVKYYVVYSATANMYNAAHPEGASLTSGRTSTLVPKINAAFQYVGCDEEIVESEDDAMMVARADLMRELFNAGVTRKQLQDHFAVQYATVYAATKGDEVTPRKKQTVIDPETNEEVSRADYVRKCFNGGMDRKAIAQHITEITGEFCDYATVWAATKAKQEAAPEAVEEAVEEEVVEVVEVGTTEE